MAFSLIDNQDHVVRFLQSAFRSQRLAGAYLFIGREGVGKALVARAFATLLTCEHPGEDACSVCDNCQRNQRGAHPDVHWYEPINNAITIAQIRELEHVMYLHPFQAARKVFVVNDAHCLREESSNALLKTLEEPARDATMILIAHDTARLLPTIRSRCQKLVFNSFGATAIQEALMATHGLDATHAQVISFLAEGSLGRALQLKDAKNDLMTKRKHILSAIYERKFALFRMDEFSIKDNTQKRQKISFLLDLLIAWFRDLLVVKSGIDAPLMNVDRRHEIERLSSRYTAPELVEQLAAIMNTRYFITAPMNINVKLAMSKLRADLWR